MEYSHYYESVYQIASTKVCGQRQGQTQHTRIALENITNTVSANTKDISANNTMIKTKFNHQYHMKGSDSTVMSGFSSRLSHGKHGSKGAHTGKPSAAVKTPCEYQAPELNMDMYFSMYDVIAASF